MYSEDNMTFAVVDATPVLGLQWNGEKYAYHKESPVDEPGLEANEIALTLWGTNWNDWSPADDDVLVFTQEEITEALQASDSPMGVWR